MSEIAEQGQTSQGLPKQSLLRMPLMMARVFLRNPGALRKLRVMGPDEERYVRPPRPYELPEYREGMPHCTSNEKYLRPTRWCNPREPLVIAMANELGAYELSDREFAEAAYWFVKSKLVLEFLPMNSVSATLQRGTGMCLHLLSLWIALCRAAGIKARYKEFKTMSDETPMSLNAAEIMALEGAEQAMDAFRMVQPHGQGEACINGEWIVAHVAMRPETHALGDLPITRFGEDEMDFLTPIPGTIEHFESIPLTRGIGIKAAAWQMSATMERSSIALADMIPLGRKIIEEAGGLEAYDREVRRRREFFSGEEIMEKIMEAERPQVLEFKE